MSTNPTYTYSTDVPLPQTHKWTTAIRYSARFYSQLSARIIRLTCGWILVKIDICSLKFCFAPETVSGVYFSEGVYSFTQSTVQNYRYTLYCTVLNYILYISVYFLLLWYFVNFVFFPDLFSPWLSLHFPMQLLFELFLETLSANSTFPALSGLMIILLNCCLTPFFTALYI